MAFKGFSGKDSTQKGGGRPALRPWRGGDKNELRLYVNHPDCEAKIWFVRGDDNDWVIKKWDNSPDEYPDFAHEDHNLAPHETVAVKVLDLCYGPLTSAKLTEQIGEILTSEEKKFIASEGEDADDLDAAAGDLGDDDGSQLSAF